MYRPKSSNKKCHSALDAESSSLVLATISILIASLMVFSFGCVKKEEKEIKIGVINSLTGSAAPYGENSQDGIRLAVDEINNNGGIKGKKIKLLVEDDKTDPQSAVAAFRKLVNVDKVPIIIGPLSSSSAMACAPLANENKVVILSPGAVTPSLTGAGDYVFRNRAPGQLEAIQMADFAYNQLNLKKVAIFYINTDYGVGFKDIFAKHFEQLGGKIVYFESFDQGQSDFRSQIAKLKGLKTDGVYILGVPIEVGNILKQSAELGFKTKFLMNNMEDPNLIKIAGKAAEGVFFVIPMFDPNTSEPNVQKFTIEYKTKYGRIPDMFAADGYDAVYIVRRAIEDSKYNGEGIKNALYAIKDFPGVNGKITFDKNGDVIKPLSIKTVKDGKFVIYSK